MSTELGWIQELRRYPIKSFRGERVTEAEVTTNGLAGDRAYALRDLKTDGRSAQLLS